MNDTTDSYRRNALLIISFAFAIVHFDFSSVNISIATIRNSLHMPAALAPWIASAYGLTYGGFLILGGKLADLYGRRRILIVGLAIFSLFSAVSALAASTNVLLAARALKGIGAALLCPASLAELNVLFPLGPKRNHALSIYGLIGSAGFALGNLLGGWVADYNWRLNLGIVFVASLALTVCAAALIRDSSEAAPSEANSRFDFGGAVLSTLAFGALFLSLPRLFAGAFTSPSSLALVASTLLLFVAFLVREKTHPAPLIPLALFRIRDLNGANLAIFFLAAAGPASVYQLGLFFQDVLRYSPKIAGLALVPFAVMAVITSFFVKYFLTRFGAQKTLAAGIAIYIVAIGLFLRLSPGSTYVANILPSLLLMDIGYPLALVAVRIPASSKVDSGRQGIANGLHFAVEQIGTAFGITALAATAAAVQLHSTQPVSSAVLDGYRSAWGLAVVFLFFSFVAASLIVRPLIHARSGARSSTTPVARVPAEPVTLKPSTSI